MQTWENIKKLIQEKNPNYGADFRPYDPNLSPKNFLHWFYLWQMLEEHTGIKIVIFLSFFRIFERL